MFSFSKNTAIFNTLSCRMYFAAVGCKQTVSGCHADTAKIRGKTSRTLAKLRAHGLIRKIPHSRRYLVSNNTRDVVLWGTHWSQKKNIPGACSHLNQPDIITFTAAPAKTGRLIFYAKIQVLLFYVPWSYNNDATTAWLGLDGISISFTPSSFFLKFADTVCKFYRLVVNFPIAESLATFSHYAPLVRHFFCDSFNRWNRDTKQVGQCCLVRCRLLFQPFKDFTFQSIF